MKLKNVTIKEFEKKVQDKNIVCYGAGELFKDMFLTMNESFLSRITCVIDTYKKLEEIKIGKFNIKCESEERLEKLNPQKELILICSNYCYEIYNKLENKLSNINIECYVYVIMSLTVSDSSRFNIKADVSKKSIPKIIHYCWFGGNDMPYSNKRCLDSWKELCPDYEIIRWDESNYDWTKNKYMYQAYMNKKWGFVPDYARLDIIYNYGGIYLDTDVELIKRPDDLLNYNGYMGFQRNFWINLGLGFGAVKNNLLVGKMKEIYDELEFIDKDGNMNMKASPYYQTTTLKTLGIQCNNITQIYDNNLILSTDYLDPQGYKNGDLYITDNTISIHHYDESWVNDKTKNDKIYCQINKIRNYIEKYN